MVFIIQGYTRFLSTMLSKHRCPRIETSLVIVICMLRVVTYVAVYELFWNRIGVVRLLFFDKEFPI